MPLKKLKTLKLSKYNGGNDWVKAEFKLNCFTSNFAREILIEQDKIFEKIEKITVGNDYVVQNLKFDENLVKFKANSIHREWEKRNEMYHDLKYFENCQGLKELILPDYMNFCVKFSNFENFKKLERLILNGYFLFIYYFLFIFYFLLNQFYLIFIFFKI